MATSGGGASEHEFALGSTNIGLPGRAINGKNFKKRFAKKLVDLFTSLLTGNKNCAGLLICEAGNIDNLVCEAGKVKMNAVIIEAFEKAGAAEHEKMRAGQPYNNMVLQSTETAPQIYWHQHCIAVFVGKLEVEELPPIDNMERVDPWRYAQRFMVRIGGRDYENGGWLLAC